MTRENVDVLIVGAGSPASGPVQAAAAMSRQVVSDPRSARGDRRDVGPFRFPGIRSDSDIFTLCYPFRPWSEARAIVDGASILDYIRDTARAWHRQRIRFHHRVVAAEWSSPDARWLVEVERTDTGETIEFSCGFLFTCTGYYRYDEDTRPSFAASSASAARWFIRSSERRGRLRGQGGGDRQRRDRGHDDPATGAPARHVTMPQRSPSYIISLPAVDPVARVLDRVLPTRIAYPLVRWKNAMLALRSGVSAVTAPPRRSG